MRRFPVCSSSWQGRPSPETPADTATAMAEAMVLVATVPETDLPEAMEAHRKAVALAAHRSAALREGLRTAALRGALRIAILIAIPTILLGHHMIEALRIALLLMVWASTMLVLMVAPKAGWLTRTLTIAAMLGITTAIGIIIIA
jgi:hypothetical protein